MDRFGYFPAFVQSINIIGYMMFSYFSFQKWYLLLRENKAEVFIYRWGYFKEKCCFVTIDQLEKRLSISRPNSVTFLIDQGNELLEAGNLPKASFLDRKRFLKNYLETKFPSHSWFGGMYLKSYQKTYSFLGIAFPHPENIMTWIEPFQKKGIKIFLKSFLIETQTFLQKKLKVFEKERSFILLIPCGNFLKQVLFLKGELRYLRTLKNPSSMTEYNHELISFKSYIKRQENISLDDFLVMYVKTSHVQDFVPIKEKILKINDLTREVISSVSILQFSQFKMLQAPYFNKFSYKKFFYKEGLRIIFVGIILGIGFILRDILKTSQKIILPQKRTPIVVTPHSIKSPPVFYLKGILYVGEKNWTFWINDKKVSTSEDLKELGYDIIQVTEDTVTLRNSESIEKIVTLKPNQTFLVKEAIVKDGYWSTRKEKSG